MKRFDGDISGLLDALGKGDRIAADELMSLVYTELRKIAASKMLREQPGQTLQATALVHEAWLRLGGGLGCGWANRAQFFAAAAEAMRRILVERARRKKAIRHGGGLVRVDAEEIEIAGRTDAEEILKVNEALENFEMVDPEKAELVKLRYFVGVTNEEAAQILSISERTAKRYWKYARAWLYDQITRE